MKRRTDKSMIQQALAPSPKATRGLNPIFTPGMARVLRWMLDEEEELVVEGFTAYVGLHRTHANVARRLLAHGLVRATDLRGMSAKYYEATSDARPALEDPNYETRINEAIRTGKVCR